MTLFFIMNKISLVLPQSQNWKSNIKVKILTLVMKYRQICFVQTKYTNQMFLRTERNILHAGTRGNQLRLEKRTWI